MSGRPSGATIPGVEEPLPPGERLLWHGRPSARVVARRVFHLPTLALYFVAMYAVRALVVGHTTPAGAAMFAGAALLALGVFALISFWVARSTVYAITSQRVVMKVGMAMPMTLNVPLRLIAGAAVREWRDGTGEIALSLGGEDRFAYFVLWPHARPWRLVKPEPALRGLRDVRAVGALLRGAAAEAGGEPVVPAAATLAPPREARRPAAAAMARSR